MSAADEDLAVVAKSDKPAEPEETVEPSIPEPPPATGEPEQGKGQEDEAAAIAVEGEQQEEEEEEEPDDGVPKVLVTGASGYIASHLIKSLLEDGKFRVRGTVRSKKNKQKTQPILDLMPNAKYPLRLVVADLLNAGSWAKAVRNCTYVFHVASPFPGGGSNLTPEMQEEKLIKPAVEGTVNVLQACADAGTVKRVVLTSSIAAISSGVHGNPGKPRDYVYSEDDWSDESTCSPYERSKTKAEHAAWDFVKKLSEDKRFELVVVNPGYVQGPLLSAVSGGGTQILCSNILSGKLAAVPDINLSLVDVRDVVAGHKAAMEKPEAAGQRHLLVTSTVALKEVVKIVKEEFKTQGYWISTLPLPKIGMWVAKLFDDTARDTYKQLGITLYFSKEKMEGKLGIKPHSIKDTIIDTCYSLIELGIVKKTQHYKGPPATDHTPDQATAVPEQTTTANVEQTPAKSEEEGKEGGSGGPEQQQEEEAKEEEVSGRAVEGEEISTKSEEDKQKTSEE